MRPEHKSRPKGHANNPQLTRYDQRLLNAKNSGKHVNFMIDCETDFAPECEVNAALIVEVDKFDILIVLNTKEHREVWLKKGHIVSTEVLS